MGRCPQHPQDGPSCPQVAESCPRLTQRWCAPHCSDFLPRLPALARPGADSNRVRSDTSEQGLCHDGQDSQPDCGQPHQRCAQPEARGLVDGGWASSMVSRSLFQSPISGCFSPFHPKPRLNETQPALREPIRSSLRAPGPAVRRACQPHRWCSLGPRSATAHGRSLPHCECPRSFPPAAVVFRGSAPPGRGRRSSVGAR